MVTVNKDGLARLVSEKSGGTLAATRETIDTVFAVIAERAEAGDTVRTAAGSFSVRARPPRAGRNPATGAAILIPETRRLVFKAARKTPV